MANKHIISRFRISIGEYYLTDGIEAEYSSSRKSNCDWCVATLRDSLLKYITQYDDMYPATVELGNGDDFDKLLDGYLIKGAAQGNQIHIMDDMIKLQRTMITDTFIECTPQDIIKYGLQKAGVTDFRLCQDIFVSRKAISVRAQNVADLIKEIGVSWNIKKEFFFKDKVFYWGADESQKIVYTLEEGKNIVKLSKYANDWEVETIGIPQVRQGEKIKIAHRKFTGEVIINYVMVKKSEDGYIRMYIGF